MVDINEHNGIFALKDTFSDYNQPYLFILSIISYIKYNPLYCVKIVSVIFDFILALFSAKIVKFLRKDGFSYILTYAIVFLLPTVILNSSAWSQCDSIYSSFVIIFLYYLLKKKYIKSFIFLGIAFSFKLQTIFILPFLLIYYFKEEKFSILLFLIIPLVNIILCLPAIIVGHPILHCFTIFFDQTQTYARMTLNMFNFWTFIPNDYVNLSNIGYAITLLVFGTIMYLTLHSKKSINNDMLINLALLSVSTCIFFLPAMHDRYLYVADILAIIFLFTNNKKVLVSIGIILTSFISYIPFLFGNNQYFGFVSLFFAYSVFNIIKQYIQQLELGFKN